MKLLQIFSEIFQISLICYDKREADMMSKRWKNGTWMGDWPQILAKGSAWSKERVCFLHGIYILIIDTAFVLLKD